MSAWRRLIATSVVAGAGLAGIGGVAAAGGRPMSTDLNGAEEVPGPGDPNASGHADLTLNQGKGEVCYDLTWADVDGMVAAAHIHVGAAGIAGPVVVPLPVGGGSDGASGCVTADPDLIKAIRKDPASYYVNVHSVSFPAGAVRGQLGD